MAAAGGEEGLTEIWIGGIGPIRVAADDDHRFDEARAWHHDARLIAQALHSADELLFGLAHENPLVRIASLPRIVARCSDDPRVLPAILELVVGDPDARARGTAIRYVLDLGPTPEAVRAVESQLDHADQDVRDDAEYVLEQWRLRDAAGSATG